MSAHDPQVITLVYDAEENRCRVDIGSVLPLVAADWLHDAANRVEDWIQTPEFVIVIDGVEQTAAPEPEED